MEFETLGNFDILLKRTGERFQVRRPKISLHNYIIGDMYIWVKDDLVIRNLNTGDQATVKFREKGWTSKHDYEIEGAVKDPQGQLRYKVVGKWDSHMSVIDPATGQQLVLAQKSPDLPNSRYQYNFSAFTVNLNHLPADMAYKIPPTDSRLRTDIGAARTATWSWPRSRRTGWRSCSAPGARRTRTSSRSGSATKCEGRRL